MTNEVKDMISKALRDEPPVGVSYETVLAAGRRRRTRRQAGIIGAAVLGVAAVVSGAMLVGNRSATSTLTPAAPTTTAVPQPAAGCAFPRGTGGFTAPPDGTATAEELAESARLTEAFAGFAFPLPAGVTMDPARPRLCAIKDSYGTQVTLRSPAGSRTVFIEVKAGTTLQTGLCPIPDKKASCAIRRLADGGMARLTEIPAAASNQPVLAAIDAWRLDNSTVRVLETGAESPKPAQRILDDDALIKIAIAPQLRVDGPVRQLSREASAQRAAELDGFLAKSPVLGNGVFIPPGFVVSQGGYKLSVDLTDGAGTGSLFVNLSPPGSAPVDCHSEPGCDLITLPDKRKATITRVADKTSMRLSLSTRAADGTQVFIMTTNRSDKTGRTRPTPPLSDNDLIRIAGQTWLHW